MNGYPTPEDYVRNALDFAHANPTSRGFTERDVQYVLDDTVQRLESGTLPKLTTE